MNLTESFRMSLRSLRANKMRSALTMLGIIIGTGSVIGLLSVGEGAQAAITEEIQNVGSNLIFILPGRMERVQGGTVIRGSVPLTREDAEAIADPERTTYVGAVAPAIERGVTVTYRGQSVDVVSMVCTTSEYEQVRNTRPELGYFFTAGEEAAEARVAVIG